MKNILILISIFLLLFSCNKIDDENTQKEKTIIGSWQLVEIYGYDGVNDTFWGSDGLGGEIGGEPNPKWYTINDGYIYTFKSDGSFTTNRVSCLGEYTLSSESLIQISGCDESNINHLLSYTLDNDNLILYPEPNFCIDSCIAKFIQVAEQ